MLNSICWDWWISGGEDEWRMRLKFSVVVGCWDCRVLSVRVNFSLVPTILWSSDDETWLIVTPFGLPQVWVGGCLLTQTQFTLTSVYIILRIVIMLLFFGAWISLHILPLIFLLFFVVVVFNLFIFLTAENGWTEYSCILVLLSSI